MLRFFPFLLSFCSLACFHLVSGTAPPYCSELLHHYSPSRSLHSAVDTWILHVPRVYRRTLGERSFQYIRAVIWNSLPFSVMYATSVSSFKSKLKTQLLSSAYWFVVFFPLLCSKPITSMHVFVWLCVCMLLVLCVCVHTCIHVGASLYAVCLCVCACMCVCVLVYEWVVCVRFEM